MVKELNPKSGRKRRRQKRPIILGIVCILLFLRVVLFAIISAFLSLGLLFMGGENSLPQTFGLGFIFVMAGLDVFLLIAVIGMWLLKDWAWQWNMMIMGFLLVAGLWIHFTDTSNWVNDLTMLFNIFIVFYLVHPDVRGLFRATEGITVHK